MISILNNREFKTINAEKSIKNNKISKEIVVIRKKKTIDVENSKNKEMGTIDVEDNNNHYEYNNGNKNSKKKKF